jgi:ribonuclease HI
MGLLGVNPGRGGFGAYFNVERESKRNMQKPIRKTTNNRMELLGVIKALLQLKSKKLPILIYTDSKYIVDSVQKKWLDNWIKTDFKGGKKNKDLWTQYYQIATNLQIQFEWVKGHADNPYNNRCDELATLAADNGPWNIDEEFEKIELAKD